MKKFFLLIILLTTFFVSGCYNNSQNSVNEKTEPNATVTADNKTLPKQQDEISKNNVAHKPSKVSTEEEIEQENFEEPILNGTSISENENLNGNANSKGEISQDNPNFGTVSPFDESQKKSETDVPQSGFSFGNFDLMTGIVIVLPVVTVILIWLIYNFCKMKMALNNMNNPPQISNVPNNPPTIIKNSTPNVTQPMPNMNMPQMNNGSQNSILIMTDNPTVENKLFFRVGNLQHIGRRKYQQIGYGYFFEQLQQSIFF